MAALEGLIVLVTVIILIAQMPGQDRCGPPDTPEDTDHLTHKDK